MVGEGVRDRKVIGIRWKILSAPLTRSICENIFLKYLRVPYFFFLFVHSCIIPKDAEKVINFC